MLAVAVFVGALVVGLLIHAPARVLDRAVASLTQQQVRIAIERGTLWQGSGTVLLRSASAEHIRAQALGWRVRWPPGGFGLQLSIDEQGLPLGHVELGFQGVALFADRVVLPARLVAAALDHPAAAFGWQGSVYLEMARMRCDWSGACDGRVSFEWHQVASDFLPQVVLGSYRVDVVVQEWTQRFAISTLQGLVAVEGGGFFSADDGLRLDVIATGPPSLVDRMPDMFHGQAQGTGVAGQVRLVLVNHDL